MNGRHEFGSSEFTEKILKGFDMAGSEVRGSLVEVLVAWWLIS